MTPPTPAAVTFTDVPARLDALPWSRFHWLVVAALGVTWILDGLEVTMVGSLAGVLGDQRTLALTPEQIGWAGSIYLIGAVTGALFFGRLTDILGRKRLFTVTLAVYLLATLATGLSWNFASFVVFRALTGAGIGGEGAAMNSAIQELIPARHRGRVDLTINGSYWVGAALAAVGAIVLLNPRVLPVQLGWRFAFIGGAALALIVIYARRYLPESPRWLMTHGRIAEAERVVAQIEQAAGVAAPAGREPLAAIALKARVPTGLAQVARSLIVKYPTRTLLGVTLMATQAFCYNAIFFTYGLILTRFYAVPAQDEGWFLLPFAIGNFLGPLVLGPLFDSLGRKPMISSTYALAGVLLAATGWLFAHGALSAVELTAAWTVVFFFASAAASAAYLTVGESFPLETRAMVIGIFYAFGTAIGGIAGPALFGAQIATGSAANLLVGYLIGGALMILAACAELAFGVNAARRPLEEIAPPLSQADMP
ncbi:MAG TPA: MFS transporter [Caulobacteraceae bacterium]|nr:MFS transporter [Caulobacteraceae bacterium]